MELAEEDRKKKLAAGREKLAAFRKKQAHRRRTQWDGGEGDRACATESQSNGSPKVSTSEIFFTPNDSSSVTGESDQFSLTSGDEWSAEEPEIHSSLYYHTKLASANQRIAELEEALEGKQLALDKMVMEMQSTALGIANKNGEDRSCNESGFELKGSVLELKEALMQRDGIIRQLTSHLQWRSASEGDVYFDVPYYLQETQRLSGEVSLLQQQLSQAGETLRNQESTCQASVQALQEAKEQIVSLRFKITEKNELLKQLSQNSADKSADLLTVKSRELELEALVKELQQQAVREAEARQVMSDTVQADANRVCLLEEELEELTNQQEETAKEFAEMQERLRNAETLCGALQKEKGEALEKIAYLEMELDRLAEDKDRAFARLSDLEEKIQDRSAIIQTSQDCDLEYGDPSERVVELEREISDLSRDHRMYIDHLNQRNAELEMLLTENLVPSRSDMSDLKNKINSQQNEILSLASQLQAAEAENAFHKVQVAELQEQLEELQKESAKEQEKHAAIRNSLEREIHVLQTGNSEYKIKLSSLEDEIVTLKQELSSSSSPVQVTVPTDSEILECEDKTLDGSGFADSTSKHLALLQKSYSNLETQFTTLLQQNSQLQSDMSDYHNLKQMHGQQDSTIRDLLSQVDHLQDATEDWTLQVQEKNYQVENLQSQLTAALKEKEELMHQISQQSEIVEKQTYSADTRVRKLESRISSLGSELTDFKDALKESETANIELQDKYDAVRRELETVKSQFAISESRATELKSEWDLEKDQLLKNLQRKAGELEKVFAEKTGFLTAAEDAEIQHQQVLKALETQYAEILQRNKHVLSERDQLIVSHSHETARLEENLKQKTEELENLLLEKNQIALELSAALAIKAEMQHQLKSQELAQTELADKHYSQKLSQAEEERVLECTKFTEELERKAQEVLLLTAERENLASGKESKETELNAQLQDLKQQLEEKVKELASVISEKEKAMQELALLQQLRKTEMHTVQVSLDQQIQEHLQTAPATENLACNWEFVRSELSNQLVVVQRKLEEKDITSADLTPDPSPLPLEASTEAQILQNLQNGAQEMQILMAENERLIELLNSEQSATAKSRHLQTLLKQREAELVILLSEWKAKEAEHQSRESALARSLKAAQQTVKEKEALLDRKKISLQDLAVSTERQDETVDKQSLELARAAEQLALTEQLSHDVLQSKQQEIRSLESKVNQLALELVSVQEERDSRMANLADQAKMFRAKEEEIVAENNSLNHQLEELKIEAQKMAEQNRAEQESMRMEMEGNKGQVHAKDLELQALAEEMCHQKNLCELQSSSIVSLEREKEELELRLLELEKEAAEEQNDYHTQCQALQAEISELKLEREEKDSRFEQEKQQLVEKSILLKDQLESATSELEQLQKDLNDRTKELESVKMDLDSMHHQKNTLQHDFAADLEDMHAKMASREEEILALSIQLRDSTDQLKQQRAAGQEEAAAAQAELDEKNLVVASLQEELDATRLQLEQTREDKETLKSNFDCCMEEMTQKASEQEDTIKQLQSRLAERSDIVNRDHGQLREIYESQLSDLEHRLAMATEEVQCLENAVTLSESEKTKLHETYSNQITELEVSLQSAELEQLRVKDQLSKMAEAHEKEILDIKHSFEIQLATVEENCQTLEKALAKQDTLVVEAAVKFKQEKAERETNFELQMSELYELSRIHETEVGRVKRQMDEMRKDHQKENQDLQQCLETQIFELENKYSIATCELERMRSSLWTMEGDFSTEKNALEQKISELEDLCLSREKQALELQDKFTRLNVQSEESNTSLIESHRSEIFHLEEANSHMAEEIKQLREKLMTAREIHNQEMEALKHHQAEEVSILQERYRQIETHSQMLQSHLVPMSAQPAYVEMSSPDSEEDRLQVELTTLEGSISVFQETLTQKEQELSQLQSQVSTLASDIDRKDYEIRSLTHEVENDRAKYIQLQMMYSDLECKNEQLTFSNHHMEENDESCKERRHLPSPEKDILMAEHKQRALATTSQLQRIDHLQHKDGSHGNSVQEPVETVQQFGSACLTSEGFEPEPDSVESLDIATMDRNSLDYFVEETDTCTTRGHRGRPRVHSMPAAVFEGFEPDLQALSFSSEHNGKVLTSKARAQKEAKSEPESSAGCFEPEEESVQSQCEETEKVEGTFTEDSFQPESLTDVPTIVHPCFTAHDQGFLPLCLDTLSASPMVIKKMTKVKDSCTQTEHLPGDSCQVLASGVCSNLTNDTQSDLSVDKKIEEEQTHPAPALQSAESVKDAAKETVEHEVSRRLAALRSDLEERWIHKMRLQEIELHYQHDTERKEYQKQLEQQCHQQVEAAKHENYVAFVKAVREMKKSFDQKKKHFKTAAGHQGRKPDKESREDGVESPVSAVGQAEEETLVKQLHKENQELAEVRDELLQQIAISRTQALRKTMQHELQTIVSECSKHLPPEVASDGAQVIPGLAGRHQGRVAEKIASILQRGEIKQQMAAVFQELLTLSQQPGSTSSEGSKATSYSKDASPTCEGDSEATSAQECFLEELEEMSQQSGQDLPLEWELTSATVTQADTTLGDFDHDQMGTGSVWEVFDGRCLRQDCLELESIKQKHEAEMASLRQQLEEHRQHSEDIHLQLQEQYLQAVSSLRDGLAQAQQQELDAVVGQLQELHQRQLQQLHAEHKYDTELEVMAVRVAVEQIQTARVRLMEEQHNQHVQRLKKEHKDQLNALRAEADRLHAGEGLIPPLSACEELTRQYQQLVQRINQSLERQVQTHVHEDHDPNKDKETVEGEETASADDVITPQQAKALQATLQAQQEEVLHLRSELLAEYDRLLQQRSAQAAQQTSDVLHLQEEMTALQQQYEQQIKEFQAHLNKKSELKEMQEPYEQADNIDSEQVKATYEQRIADMEDSFTRQIVALEQTALHIPDDAIDALTSKLAAYSSTENESPLPSQRLVFVKDYVHRSTFVDGTSNVDTDTTASSWGMYDHEDRRLQEFIKTMEEKNSQVEELERSLDRERQRTNDFVEELGISSQQLSKLAAELEEQKQVVQKMVVLLEEKDRQLQETQHKAAESEKLLREITEKEDRFQKEKGHEDGLHAMHESDIADSGLVTSPSSVEEEVRRMKTALDQATAALRAMEQRERRLQEQLEEFEHQHQEALEALRQEMEHEAQVERDSLQSEFQVQLEVEMRRQAAELQRQFVEQTARTMGITSDSCPASSRGEVLEEEGTVVRTAAETSAPPHIEAGDTVQETVVVQEVCLTLETLHSANRGMTSATLLSSGTQTEQAHVDVSQNLVGANYDSVKEQLKSDFDKQMEQLRQAHEAEKTRLAKTHLEEMKGLQDELLDAEEKYDRLKEVIEEHEGAGVDQLLKDRYDMELELAKSLMQKEFDDTLAAEKKKFVERHRQLMDGFMSEQEAEADKIKQQHQQNLSDLKSCLATMYMAIIADLQALLKDQKEALLVSEDDFLQVPSEKEKAKSQEEEKETDVKDAEDADLGREEESEDVVVQELHRLCQNLRELCHLVAKLTMKYDKAVTNLTLQHEARLSELKAEHQDQLEAAALDTDVLKSELELAHADLESLRQKLASQLTARIPNPDQLDNEKTSASPSSREGDQTPDVRSSLEYEETDEEGSIHSFSSMLGKTRSFDNGSEVKTASPSQSEQRIKQLKAEIEQLTQQLEQQRISAHLHAPSPVTVSPPSVEAVASLGARRGSKESESVVAMLQSDLDRISAERDTIQQINNRLLQLLSDSIHTYVEVEDHINRRLHSIVSVSGARPQSPALPQHDGSDNFPARSGAGVAASSIVISRATGIMSSPRSDHGWQPGEADTSLTLEETSILSIATDEGLDMSQRLADSIFTGPDIGAEGEEIVGDARGRLQSAVGHLLDMIGQTTQQLMEAKITQTDLLESLAARSSENSTLAAHIQDLEEQLRQEVSAKEYFSLELHKAEGLIKGYSSEREMMEEEMQLLEEQKETLARDLETTRSQLQDFQDAAGELEARRQDVERHQMLLQQNAGQEAQESSMAGGDTNKSEEQALLAEVNTVKQERREQTLQLQHRLEQAQQSLHDREANLEELERALQHERDEMREQVQDLRLQLENAERQLKSNKQFLNDQMNERELEREEFQREIERLKQQLQDQDRQEGSYVSLHHEIQDLTEQLQVRMEREAVMHQKIQELQQTLQDSDLSAQDLRVWIATLETELDQRGDTEQQLKDHIHKLERQLTQDNGDAQSVESGSPVATCRPVSPGSADLSLRQPAMQPALSYVSLEEELKRSQQAKEELVHQKEALKHTVQEQLLQISALRNQLDDLRHWRGPPDTSASASTTADLRDELESEREAVQKKEEEIFQLKSTLENLEKQLAIKQRELEQLTDQFQKLQQTCVTSDQVAELQKERSSLKARVGELSAAHAFPPELLEEKNAEIDELRHQLCQKEVRLKEKDELISDLQDTVLSLQRGETCLDVSLPFNEPVSLNASFTERTTLAQELDQTASEQEGQIVELNSQVERLGQEVAQLKDQLQEAVAGRTALETELQQKDDDLSQLQEEKAQKQETLVEKDSRLEQLMVQVKSLQTEINNLTAFQVELQKDYDTVQNMLEEKEQEIESLTREYLEARSQPDGSDELEAALAVAQKKLREQGNVIEEKEEELYELRDQLEAMDSLKEELNTLTTRLAEKEAELQKEKNLLAEVQKELAGIQQAEHNQEQNTDHQLAAVARTLEEQISLLKAEVLHLEESVKDKEQLIKNLEEEKCAAAAEHEMELATMRNHLTATQDEVATKLSQLEMLLAHKEHSLQQVESLSDKKLHAKEQEATALREDLEKKNETIEKLEGDVLLLQQQVTERDSSIRDLHQRSRQQQDHLKGEITHLEEQLHHLSSTTENAATDEDKALQNELAQASDRIVDLEQQLVSTQSHLEEALTRVEEKENHVQQLQEEMRRLQLGAAEGQAEDFEQRVRVDSLSCLPESSEDTEVHDERLRDFLAKAEQMQMTVQESLSASLPMPSDAQRLSRWDSEPGLSSTYPAQLVTLTFGTETWMRRQQRELASKNRELALLREELEGWLKRKGRSQETLGSASTVLQLYEKESVIISLKRELAETKALLAAAEKRAAQSSESFVSMELSPQTKQQIAHLRSELRLAKAALAALQEHSQADGVSTNVGGEAKHVEQRELNDYDAQTQLHHSSATMCATDFVKKVQELREEIALEHQNHIRNIQEAARHDMEIKMTEMQARHDHEVQQLRSRHEQRLEQALAHQQQALEKQHKTELNSLCVQHQQEIERLRSEELASLTDAAITNRLRVDVRGTQQVEDGLIGSFHSRSDDGSRDDLSTVETSSVVSGSEEVLPPRLQALLNRLRQAGDHILSISELNFLLQHLAPQGEASSQTLVEAFESEKSSLVKATHALKELLSQADRVGCGLQEIEGDWRSELLHALVEVYKRERLTLESELYTLRLQHPSMATADIIKSFDNRLREQEQLQQSGLDAMLRAERQSLLAELEDLRSRLLRQRTEQQEQQARLSDALAKMEEQASSKEWKLQREVQVLEYKLQQEKVIQEDLQKRLEAERRHTTELSAELSRSKAALTLLQSELQSTHIQLSRARDALEREQHRFTSVTDALEEERQKNNRLAEMLETLRRQHHNLETERSRLEAIYKERETTENKVIKELRAELASQRENLRKTTESAEKERRDRQQALTAASEVQQANVALRQEVDKVQHQTKKVLEGEATKLQELQNKMKQDHVLVGELQGALEDRDSIIARLTQELSQLDDLQLQVQQLQKTMASSEQQLEKERKQVSHLTNILDKEREEHGAALQQELGQAKQLRSELSAMKAEASNVCHQLDLEKARAEGLHLDLERAQSELRVLTQHAGVTERQLEAEQTATWNRLRAVQHEKDELEIKVHQLELELERIQDKVQDLELELDRCCRRELEARHDVERHKLYPAVSPRMTSADGQTEVHDAQLQARLSTFIRQLQGVGERLHVLLLRQSNRSSTTDAAEEASRNHDGSSVGSLLQELQALRDKMFSRDQFDGGDSKQMVELDQLKTCLTTLTREKEELQRRLDLLENEDNIRTLRTSQTNTTISTSSSSSAKRQKQPPTMPQYVSDAASDDEFVYERTVWASERLSLQMALDSAEREIDHLKKELRHFRGRFDSEGFMVEADKNKMQRLYGKYLRAESFRKALVYQKKYLLLLLGGYQDSEQETLAIIATMGGQPSSTLDLAYRRRHRRLYTIFRSAARTVVAIFRMKYLVRKWKRATRVGSPIVSGRLNHHYGYVATTGSFTQPNFTDPDNHYSSPSATSSYVNTIMRGSPNGNVMSLPSHSAMSHIVGDGGGGGNPAGVRFSTPPTKEFTHTQRPSNSPLSTNARRHLLHILDAPQKQSGDATEDNGGFMGAIGGESVQTDNGVGDDFLQRLENLQTRLSSQNGPTMKRPAWR